jgi:hypothetical protein
VLGARGYQRVLRDVVLLSAGFLGLRLVSVALGRAMRTGWC